MRGSKIPAGAPEGSRAQLARGAKLRATVRSETGRTAGAGGSAVRLYRHYRDVRVLRRRAVDDRAFAAAKSEYGRACRALQAIPRQDGSGWLAPASRQVRPGYSSPSLQTIVFSYRFAGGVPIHVRSN